MVKKLFLTVVLGCIASFITDAQSNPPGRFSFSAGYDLGAHATLSKATYKGTQVDEDTSGAASQLFQFNAHYSITKWFSAGLGFRMGSYIEDPNDPDTQYESNKVGEFYLDTRFYFLNKDKFNMYGNLSLGSTKLSHFFDNSAFTASQYYRGSNFRLGLGFNWYFTKYVGLWCNLEYASRNYTLNEFNLNGQAQDLTDYKYTLQTKGAHFAIGVCVKLK